MRKYIFVLVLLLSSLIVSATEVPYLMGRVNDYANILSDQAKMKIDQLLRTHESETSNQIVILTIQSLGDEVLEDYAYNVFNTWHLGQQVKDNGVLILISVNDKKIRIEVGYGLEGYLTDAQCSSIIRNEMAPNFRRDDYDAGVISAVSAVIGSIEGSYKPEDITTFDEGFESVPFPMNIVMGIFVMSILGIFTFVGLFSKGCSSWFLFVFLIPFYATFPIFIFGLTIAAVIFIIYFFGFIFFKIFLGSKKGKNILEKYSPKLAKGLASASTFTSKSWSSSSGWSSGGGFSGGGGSSGGGGASGGW
ncbi:MAG: hypothetical protein A2V66_16150 [Ignavibacteria bacterium RBG_13_36_8]|nr:MAG: hypothetical protein A2V66_16150 [Ignavibacteria bacterium RBG_13_36_8]